MKVTSAQPQKIFMPTQDQLKAAYSSAVDSATKNHTLKALKGAPVGASKVAPLDITKKGVLGVDKKVYNIGGELYLKSQVVAPNAKPSWFKVGPAPLF